MENDGLLNALYHGGEDVLVPREDRQREAENQIRVLAHLLELTPSSQATDRHVWASDGSVAPASAGTMDDKSVTAALTGPMTMVMKIGG